MNIGNLVNGTVEIRIGDESIGSGFRMVKDDIIITNSHILPPTPGDVPIRAVTPNDTESGLEVVDVSPEPRRDGHDYAILRAVDEINQDCEVLQPAKKELNRGDTVWFAGYPFDISEPLVHTAIVSGTHPHGFYFDGSVNYHNSGGPIVIDGDRVVGMVTKSEMYKSHSVEENIENLYGIQEKLTRVQDVHKTEINEIDIEGLAIDTIQEIQNAVDILTDNVSSGIGVGYSIDPVLNALKNIDI